MARALQAVKVIYLTTHPGIPAVGKADEGPVHRHLPVGEANCWGSGKPTTCRPTCGSKLDQAVRAVRGGVPRPHHRRPGRGGVKLAEVFSNDGIGTMIHTNEYQAIRRGGKSDGDRALIQAEVEPRRAGAAVAGVRSSGRSTTSSSRTDRTPGMRRSTSTPRTTRPSWPASASDPRHENQGIGGKLMRWRGGAGPRAGCRHAVLPVHAGVQLLPAEGRFSSRHAGRPAEVAATATTRAAESRRCC
ncbi:MAG: hypothetical protein U0797_09210 [Gemmataceae bacterium]